MSGTTHIYPWQFDLFVHPEADLDIREVEFNGKRFRIYPPFRNKPENFSVIEGSIDPVNVPYRKYRQGRENITYTRSGVIVLPLFESPINVALAFARGDGIIEDRKHIDRLPKDSIRIDAYETTEAETEAFHLALVTMLRWKTGQWWVGRSRHSLGSNGPHKFPINQGGDVMRKPQDTSNVTTFGPVFNTERSLDLATWEIAIQELSNNAVVPLYDLLLMDARYFACISDFRQAVLNADAACEHTKETVFESLWLTQNPGGIYDREAKLRNWDLPRHIDGKFYDHFRRSYKLDYPTNWNRINDLWNARNNIAHGGPASYGTLPTQINRDICSELITAADHCVRWLLSI